MAAARMLEAQKVELGTRALTPEQLNVTKRLKI